MSLFKIANAIYQPFHLSSFPTRNLPQNRALSLRECKFYEILMKTLINLINKMKIAHLHEV